MLLSTAAASIERRDTPWGPLTPWTTSADHLDPARRMLFFLGIGQPSLMTTSPVPVSVSAKRLAQYRSRGEKFPVKAIRAPYAGDSGAYSAIMLTADPRGHPWWTHPDEYGALWTRLIEDIGPPLFVGIQDVPCEPGCLRFTGSTTRRHQQATTGKAGVFKARECSTVTRPDRRSWTFADLQHPRAHRLPAPKSCLAASDEWL